MNKMNRDGTTDEQLFEMRSQSNAREVITTHIGQGGCRVGLKMWELIAFEHGIDKKGHLIEDSENHTLQTLFSEVIDSARNETFLVPRACFIDLEPSGNLHHKFVM